VKTRFAVLLSVVVTALAGNFQLPALAAHSDYTVSHSAVTPSFVPWTTLNADPSAYKGKLVSTSGFLRLDGDNGTDTYFDKIEDAQNHEVKAVDHAEFDFGLYQNHRMISDWSSTKLSLVLWKNYKKVWKFWKKGQDNGIPLQDVASRIDNAQVNVRGVLTYYENRDGCGYDECSRNNFHWEFINPQVTILQSGPESAAVNPTIRDLEMANAFYIGRQVTLTGYVSIQPDPWACYALGLCSEYDWKPPAYFEISTGQSQWEHYSGSAIFTFVDVAHSRHWRKEYSKYQGLLDHTKARITGIWEYRYGALGLWISSFKVLGHYQSTT